MTSSDETCDLDQVPNRPKILNEIETLRPIFMEGYRRSRGLELFPNAWTLSMAPDKIAAEKENHYMIEHGGAWEWRTPPGSAVSAVTGYFRYSGVLGLYMPTAIPDDTNAYCRDERRAAWVASTAADDEYIESYARENTRSDIEAITEAFEAVFEQCPTWKTRAVIRYTNRLAEGITDLIAKAHEGIIEATGYQPSNTETATRKFVGTITVNRVPFLGYLIAAVDYGITLTSQGKVDDGASRYVNAFMDKVWPNYGTALTSQLCNEVRDDLVNGADEILNELYDYRGKIANDYLAQSAEDFGAMPIKDLVPGYRSGT